MFSATFFGYSVSIQMLTLPRAQEIDDPDASALAASGQAPTQLAHAARTGDDRASLGIRKQSLLKPGVFVV
jgi:hypothetical protein